MGEQRILLLDTSIGSYNKGDDIIQKSINNILSPWFNQSDLYRVPTHLPVFTEFESIFPNHRLNFFYKGVDVKLLCGTDCIAYGRRFLYPQWDVNFLNNKAVKNTICLAVGVSDKHDTPNLLYKLYYKMGEKFYKNVFKKDAIHSVRDKVTEEYLKKIGFDAVNTGCITTWGLTPDFCKSIPTTKAEKVVFTLNSRTPDLKNDRWLVHKLLENYNKLYFFPQQWTDVDYFGKLDINNEKIERIPMNIDALSNILFGEDVDYVGLRLHCGIYAMQHKKRAIILKVDHRAKDISETQHLNLVNRNEHIKIQDMIFSELQTKIHVPYDNINRFLQQFSLSLSICGEKARIQAN